MKARIKELEPYRALFIEKPVLAEHDDVIKQSEESETYSCLLRAPAGGNDSNLLIVFYVQIMPDDFVMQLHRF